MAYAKPVNLVMKRGSQNGGDSVEATWGFTGGSTFNTSVEEDWRFNASKDMTNTVIEQTGAGSATGDVVWTRPSGTGLHTSAYCFYNRQRYHPLVQGRYLTSVKLEVFNGEYGGRWYVDWATTAATMSFKRPGEPSISEPSYNSTSGRVSFAIAAADDDGQAERYDTMYRILRQDSADRENQWASEKAAIDWASTTDASKSIEYPVWDDQPLEAGQWVRVTCEAYSRGLAGDSDAVSKEYLYAWPAQAAITSIVASSLEGDGIVTVRISSNATDIAPVDSVKLQRLRSSTASTATAAGLADGWQDVGGAVDAGGCSGLTDQVTAALPTVKTHTWYRLVTTHGSLSRNSVPVEARCLYRAKDEAAGDAVKFVYLEPGADGGSVMARLAWNDDGSDTTQISWSEFEDAWESTEQPDSCDVTWEDESDIPTGYDHAATVSIRGLEERMQYYARARRARTKTDPEAFGGWCYPDKSLYPVSTATAPDEVVLAVPATVERGCGIDCSWTFNGSEQTGWELAFLDDGVRKVLVSGEGPAGATVVPADLVSDMDSVMLSVSVTTGGDWASSDWLPVSIEDAPELAVSVPGLLTEQPLQIVLTSTSPRADVVVYVTSRGVFSARPDGESVQADGDVVWAESLSPAWVADGNLWTAPVTPPTICLHDGATYDVTAVATDTKTLLSSEKAAASFAVSWSHKASEPSPSTTVEADRSTLAARITPAAPSGAAETDLVDVYRYTPDGAYPIATDVPFGYSVTDRFAPFSSGTELGYRLCTRTKDGDLAWADYPYELSHTSMRFDFGEQHLELPYNIVTSDSWQKSFELREHMDGTRAGYWNPGATRSGALSTDIIKMESAEARSLLAELAKHAGPCFVRTPNGCAYPANVEVESYGLTFDSVSVPVSLKATEVAMTDAFAISPSDWEVPE